MAKRKRPITYKHADLIDADLDGCLRLARMAWGQLSVAMRRALSEARCTTPTDARVSSMTRSGTVRALQRRGLLEHEGLHLTRLGLLVSEAGLAPRVEA